MLKLNNKKKALPTIKSITMLILMIGIYMLKIPQYTYATTYSHTPNQQEVVILLHGLGRTSRSMKKIQSTLEKEGYNVKNIDYPSKKYPIDQLVDTYIKPIILQHSQKETIHFVTHSLGGILVRFYLETHTIPNL